MTMYLCMRVLWVRFSCCRRLAHLEYQFSLPWFSVRLFIARSMTLMLFRHTIISANKNQCSSRKEMLFHKCACVLQPRGVGGSLRIEMCFSTSLLQFYSTAKCPPIYPVILLCMSLILECTLSRQKSETINGRVFLPIFSARM